jgi:hypothetical protein
MHVCLVAAIYSPNLFISSYYKLSGIGDFHFLEYNKTFVTVTHVDIDDNVVLIPAFFFMVI